MNLRSPRPNEMRSHAQAGTTSTAGGTLGQYLRKNSGTDSATEWATLTASLISDSTVPGRALLTAGTAALGLGTAATSAVTDFLPITGGTLTGPLGIQSGSAQFSTALTISASTHPTSRRAGFGIGDWSLIQDQNGVGTKDYGLFNGGGSDPGFAYSVSTARVVDFPKNPTTGNNPLAFRTGTVGTDLGFNLAGGDWRGLDVKDKLNFGTAFYTQHHITSTRTSQHVPATDGVQSRATLAITRDTAGSGVDSINGAGPGNADYALYLGVRKTNAFNSSIPGEVDCGQFSALQGRLSDCGGILATTQKVRHSTLINTGGSTPIEAQSLLVNEGGGQIASIQCIVGGYFGAGDIFGGTGVGLFTEAQTGGTQYAGIYVGNTLGNGTTTANASFSNVLVAATSRSEASKFFDIDGNGRVHANPGSPSLPSYSFIGDTDTGIYRPSADALGFATGSVARWFLDSAGHFYPVTDGAYDIGAAGTQRVRSIYTINGVTQVSDARTKTDIQPSSLGSTFMKAVGPADSWRFIEGRRDVVLDNVEVEVEEVVTRRRWTWQESDEVVEGVATRTRKRVYYNDPVADNVPVLDLAGNPVLDTRTGNPLVMAVPRKHRVKKTIQVPREVSIPGKRRHHGLLAQKVKAALDATGVDDFAGWVKADPSDPDSIEGLRPDQITLSALWNTVLELLDRCERLEAQIAAGSK